MNSREKTDLRERTGFGMGRDRSNFDLNYLLDDEHGRQRQGIAFKDEIDSNLSPPVYNQSIKDKEDEEDMNFKETKHYSQSLVKINPHIIEIPSRK